MSMFNNFTTGMSNFLDSTLGGTFQKNSLASPFNPDVNIFGHPMQSVPRVGGGSNTFVGDNIRIGDAPAGSRLFDPSEGPDGSFFTKRGRPELDRRVGPDPTQSVRPRDDSRAFQPLAPRPRDDTRGRVPDNSLNTRGLGLSPGNAAEEFGTTPVHTTNPWPVGSPQWMELNVPGFQQAQNQQSFFSPGDMNLLTQLLRGSLISELAPFLQGGLGTGQQDPFSFSMLNRLGPNLQF